MNGLPSVELKYHYPSIDSDLLAKIKEQEIVTLYLSDAVISPSDVTRDYAPLGLNDRNVTQGTCPIKVLEYMASSRPLIASNMPIVRELVREDVDAILFSPNDPGEFGTPSIETPP